ncbi:MAG: hypothetical protein QME16_00120 [Planctomycetota bacterium]|nr:hypothetical protein [Planctomycetota bacterium]
MSKIEVDLQNLSTLDAEIKLKESRKIALNAELETLAKEIISAQDRANKEIAQMKQSCDDECQEKIVKVNKLLKEAQAKLALVEQREKDSEAIREQMAKLQETGKSISDMQKSADKVIATASEKEHKASLLIEQYTKKLEELSEKPKEEKPKEEKPKKK